MPEPVKGDQKYLPGLDGLRALAVAFVVAYHLGYGWAQGGLLGVGVFFTLSGYLITDILVGQWAARGRIRLGEFWLRRARRLLPALFLMLAVVAIWVNAFARSFVPGFRGDVVASALYVSNWWYIGQNSSYYARFALPGPLDHLWSLAVEEQFYLLWPWVVLVMVLLVGRMHRRRRGLAAALGGLAASGTARAGAGAAGAGSVGAAGALGGGAEPGAAGVTGAPGLSGRARLTMAGVTLGLAAASAIWMAVRYQPGYDPTRVYEGTDTRAFGLLIGAAVAMVWPTRRAVAAKPLPAAARWLLDLGGLTGLVVICVMVVRINQYSNFVFQGGLELLSVATALTVAAAVTPGSLFGRALGVRPLRWLGVRSYGIYLWHYPLIVLTAGAAGAAAEASLPRAVAIVAGTVAVAAFSWHFVEDPIRTGKPVRLRPAGPVKGKAIFTPGVVSVVCLIAALVLAGGVTMATRLTADSGSSSDSGQAGSALPGGALPGGGANAANAAAAAQSARLSKSGASATPSGSAGAGSAGARSAGKPETNGAAITSAGLVSGGTGGSAAVSSFAIVPALPTPPPQTSCKSVVHIGDSTSDGLISSDYEPNPANLITARYADVGVKQSIMKIVGATSVVESLPGTPNAYQMASQVKQDGFHGCWVLALGTNDTADVYVGSNVGRVQRIEKMMKLIGGQPVMWVEVTSLLSSGPYSEQNMELWNQALKQVLPQYPDMRIYNWPAVAQKSWFINDEIHYTSLGYLYRGKDIADALAEAFPAS